MYWLLGYIERLAGKIDDYLEITMKKVLLTLACSLLAVAVNAGDAAAGKAKSSLCVACHTESGISAIPIYPNLAGQKEAYLVSSMKAYKSKERKGGNAAIMWTIAGPLSDEDINDLAAYYSSLPAGK
jgi:cytochrome c553